jgi:hypothetical protein
LLTLHADELDVEGVEPYEEMDFNIGFDHRISRLGR